MSKILHKVCYLLLMFGPFSVYVGLVIVYPTHTLNEYFGIGVMIIGLILSGLFKKFFPIKCPACNQRTLYLVHSGKGAGRFAKTTFQHFCYCKTNRKHN